MSGYTREPACPRNILNRRRRDVTGRSVTGAVDRDPWRSRHHNVGFVYVPPDPPTLTVLEKVDVTQRRERQHAGVDVEPVFDLVSVSVYLLFPA